MNKREFYVDPTDRTPPAVSEQKQQELLDLDPEVYLLGETDLRRAGMYTALRDRNEGVSGWDVESKGNDEFEDALTRADLHS